MWVRPKMDFRIAEILNKKTQRIKKIAEKIKYRNDKHGKLPEHRRLNRIAQKIKI